MITRKHPIKLNLEHTYFQDCDKSGLLFFDIETTGLSARSSSLYLIGAVSLSDNEWCVSQWFAENPNEEAAVLSAFLDFASGFSQLVHFNGERFDLPYLAQKCAAYQLTNVLTIPVSRDLYRMIRPLKKLLNLPSLKQKSIEEFLGICRRDPYSGQELISIYQDYVNTPDSERLGALLLHNYEDLLGMLAILPVLSYLALLDGSCCFSDYERTEESLIMRAWLPAPFPQPFSFRHDLFYLTVNQNRLAIQVNFLHDVLKHFFSDYKNYYYLPLEDTAIHKSIAAYVDKNFREPAKASTCFSKKEGFYLPQTEPLFTPLFKKSYEDRLMYFPCSDTFLGERTSLQAYLQHLLSML